MNFSALYLSLRRLSEVVDQRSLGVAGGASAIAFVPAEGIQRAILVTALEKATLSWLREKSFSTLNELIATDTLTYGSFFTHEGPFSGKGIIAGQKLFAEGKQPEVMPTLEAKLPSIGPHARLKIQAHPENFTGNSIAGELAGRHRLFLVGRLTACVPPTIEAQAYAIGHLHDQPLGFDGTIDPNTLVARGLSQKQRDDYKEFGYRCQYEIFIPGKTPMQRNNLVIVNRKEVRLTDATFTLFLRHVLELKKGKGGWIEKSALDEELPISVNYQAYAILRNSLRNAIEEKDLKELIQNIGNKRYRISTHPDFVTYDRPMLLNHPESPIVKIANDLP
jgi:hypothetical protein